MKGASAEVCANTSSAPTRTRSSRIGASHHFFRTRSSAHTSRTTLAWLIACASSEQTFHVTPTARSEEHTSELQSRPHLVCRLLLEKKKIYNTVLIDSFVISDWTADMCVLQRSGNRKSRT